MTITSISNTQFLNLKNVINIIDEHVTLEILFCSLMSCYTDSKPPILLLAKSGAVSIDSLYVKDCISQYGSHAMLLNMTEANIINTFRLSVNNCGSLINEKCVDFVGETIVSNTNCSNNKGYWEPAIKMTSQYFSFQSTLLYSNIVDCTGSQSVVVSAYGLTNTIKGLNAVNCSIERSTGSVLAVTNYATISLSNFIYNTCKYDINGEANGIIEKCYIENPAKIYGIVNINIIDVPTSIFIAEIPGIQVLKPTLKITKVNLWSISIVLLITRPNNF